MLLLLIGYKYMYIHTILKTFSYDIHSRLLPACLPACLPAHNLLCFQ